MIVSSIQVGQVRTEGDPQASDPNQKQWTSAFRKSPVNGPVMAGQTGLSGDSVANEQHHGGIDKAVLAYAASHYGHWRTEVPELGAHPEFGPGGFAENLTVDGADESNVCIGDRYRSGECLFEVSQPRQPCWKIGRRWQLSRLTKQVAKTRICTYQEGGGAVGIHYRYFTGNYHFFGCFSEWYGLQKSGMVTLFLRFHKLRSALVR